MTPEYFTFAKAVLWWAMSTRRMRYQEFNRLTENVRRREFNFLRCNGKVRFETHEMARQVGERNRLFHKTNKRRVPYPCQFCGGFHLADAIQRGQVRKAHRKMRADRMGDAYV